MTDYAREEHEAQYDEAPYRAELEWHRDRRCPECGLRGEHEAYCSYADGFDEGFDVDVDVEA